MGTVTAINKECSSCPVDKVCPVKGTHEMVKHLHLREWALGILVAGLTFALVVSLLNMG